MNTHKQSARAGFPYRRMELILPLLICICFAPILCRAQTDVEITLKNSFIEKYKDRATIEGNFVVDRAHAHPNPPSKDGDMHIAGRSDQEIRLPIVAEIMNARFEKNAMQLVHRVEGSGSAISVAGAWRIWCEHGGLSPQVQGEPLSPFTTTNPDHVFEIHPLTKIQDQSLLDSFMPIEGYATKDATVAFMNYENRRSQITANPSAGTTTIATSMGGFNYVEFVMEITGEPKVVGDGEFVFASVYDLNGELLVKHRRMVFVKDSPPELVLKRSKVGQRLHVLGVPRIDLAVISWRVQHRSDRPEALTWGLPYEIIVVATYEPEE
jgi:hypothetical protein